MRAVQSATQARDHRMFPGRLVKRELGFAERAVVTALRTPDGDFRPWNDIDTYGRDIARALDALIAAATPDQAVAQPAG